MSHRILKQTGDKAAEYAEHPTLLDALDHEHIMTVTREGDIFLLTEHCDDYYSIGLTPNQLCALGNELIAMSQRNTDNP